MCMVHVSAKTSAWRQAAVTGGSDGLQVISALSTAAYGSFEPCTRRSEPEKKLGIRTLSMH